MSSPGPAPDVSNMTSPPPGERATVPDAPDARPRPLILGRLLVERGAVGETELRSALAEQRTTGERIGEVLVREGAVDEETVARALADQLSLPFSPPPLHPDPAALDAMRADLARSCWAVPIAVTARTLTLAMADPLDLDAVDDIRFRTGRRVDVVVTTPGAVERALDGAGDDGLEELLAELERQMPTVSSQEDRDVLEAAARSAPVVRLVDHLLRSAARRGGSDLHVERTRKRLRVRVRVDGLLRPLAELPGAGHAPVISRLKVMAGLDISVKRRPQDGAFSFEHRGAELAVRLSTLPVSSGEKAVLRILDPERAPAGVQPLGLRDADLRRVRRLLGTGQGVILAAGPTGSGKSTTLFGALAEVDRASLNVVTLEDPVEYRLSGVSQVQVDPRAGLGFAAALRSVLRQDPDVVMVGEIRDRETAEIAMAAAITGHLVLSTVHTIDAPAAVTRLLNMGVPPYLVAGGLSGVIAQRLVRRLCASCRGRDAECDRCLNGYRGRTGIFQVLVMTDRLREAVVRGASTATLRRLASNAGTGTLVEDARRKVAEGLTTPHEVARVIQADPGASSPCSACGFDVPTGAEGCPRCGRRRVTRCACGKEVKRGWRFCAWCLRPRRSGAAPPPISRPGPPVP